MPETAVFDHYEVLTRDDGSLFELGRGAMGITYKAFDTSLRIPVALKVINATYLNSEVARQRFVREARSAAQLRHRHVASVFHLGTEGDTWFYAMEFIDGETLDALIKRQGPLNPVIALTIAAQVARALNAASQHGLVHRDIKPANLMLVKEDDELVAKVIDFGLAKASIVADGEDAATLSLGGFVGTPHFASPEQLEEKEIDSRSDIYSLGVTLWYMLAGQAPFAGSMAQVMSQHLSKPPPFEKLDKLHPAVAEVLRLMLAKDPADRFQTPADLRKGIEVAIEKITSSGGAPAMTAEAIEHTEDFATLLDDSTMRSGVGSFETNTTIANRYRVAQTCGETNAGRVFRAYDTERKTEVRLIVLHPEALADGPALSALEREVDKLLPIKHPNLLGVLGFETVDRGSFLVLEWTEGFSVLDLLKARRELDADEALKLLQQAAAGADEALRLDLNNLEFGLHQLQIHFPEPVEKEKLLRAPLSTWPAFALKLYPLGATRDFAASQTWAGGQTMVGGGAKKSTVESAEARPQYVQALGAVTYEILGGTLSPLVLRGGGGPAARYTPLSTLSEEGNEVLRQALDIARSFPSATDFSTALARLDGLQVRRHEPRSAPPVAPAPSPARSVAAAATQSVAPTPTRPTPPPVPTPFTPPQTKSVPIALIGGVAAAVVIAIVGLAFFFLHNNKPIPGPDPSTHGTASGDSTPTPSSSGDTVPAVADVTPVATPIPATPIPATPIPATPIPVTPPPGPSRQELLRNAVNVAQELEDKGQYTPSLRAWLDVAKNYTDFPVGKNHLETMLAHLRERPSPITSVEFKQMRPMIDEAAQLGVLAGMMLIADNVREQEPETAFTWYSKAKESGSIPALTQLGIMYSNVTVPGTPDLVKAARSFQMAADKGDVPAKYLLGECYLIGKGVDKDEGKALEFFREAADAGDLRSLNRLGDCYVHGTGGKVDLPEAFRLFSKAADAGSYDALGNLGVLYVNGDTPDQKPDPKKAVELWKKGVEKLNPFCTWLYARSLESGKGVTPNPMLAKQMYQKAANLGERHAVDWCRKNFVPFTPQGG